MHSLSPQDSAEALIESSNLIEAHLRTQESFGGSFCLLTLYPALERSFLSMDAKDYAPMLAALKEQLTLLSSFLPTYLQGSLLVYPLMLEARLEHSDSFEEASSDHRILAHLEVALGEFESSFHTCLSNLNARNLDEEFPDNIAHRLFLEGLIADLNADQNTILEQAHLWFESAHRALENYIEYTSGTVLCTWENGFRSEALAS